MLVLGSGTAVAATGGKLILGRGNSATTTTTLTNSKGTALTLAAPAGKAPLAVNGGTKVTNLNADKVDGLSSENLARAAGTTTTVTASAFAAESSPGSGDDLLVAFADCPGTSVVTGGGFSDSTSSGVVVESSPDSSGGVSSWLVVAAVDPAAGDLPEQLGSWALCYDPRGGLPAQLSARTSAAEARRVLTPELTSGLEKRAAVR
jgi:hypothetical protein